MIDFEEGFSKLSTNPDKDGNVKTIQDFCPKFYDSKRGEDVSFCIKINSVFLIQQSKLYLYHDFIDLYTRTPTNRLCV